MKVGSLADSNGSNAAHGFRICQDVPDGAAGIPMFGGIRGFSSGADFPSAVAFHPVLWATEQKVIFQEPCRIKPDWWGDPENPVSAAVNTLLEAFRRSLSSISAVLQSPAHANGNGTPGLQQTGETVPSLQPESWPSVFRLPARCPVGILLHEASDPAKDPRTTPSISQCYAALAKPRVLNVPPKTHKPLTLSPPAS